MMVWWSELFFCLLARRARWSYQLARLAKKLYVHSITKYRIYGSLAETRTWSNVKEELIRHCAKAQDADRTRGILFLVADIAFLCGWLIIDRALEKKNVRFWLVDLVMFPAQALCYSKPPPLVFPEQF